MKLPLSMKYHSKSGRYFVWNGTDSRDGKLQQVLHFPDESEIKDLWETFFPRVDFELEQKITRPVSGFWVVVGPATTPEGRQKFCDALLEQCEVTAA